MSYTYIWNRDFINNTKFINRKSIKLALEVGSFEGLTSNFIAENLLSPDGKLICIDPLTDFYLNDNLTEIEKKKNATDYAYFKNQYERFIENTKNNKDKIQLIRKLSHDAYPELLETKNSQFDLIYIDGDHRADGVYCDAINCFQLCKVGGYILFDDYLWNLDKDGEKAPLHGINKFLNEYTNKLHVTLSSYQLMIQRKE